MAENINQEWDKLAKLTHYICFQRHAPRMLDATKLNKILWYTDLIAYLKTGKQITGETYVKQRYGPVPKHIPAVIGELEEKRDLVVKEVPFVGKKKRQYIALTEPDISMFSPEEVNIVDSVMDVVCHRRTASSIGLASHDVIWKLAEIGEEIPMYAVLASELGEVTEKDIRWAQEALARS